MGELIIPRGIVTRRHGTQPCSIAKSASGTVRRRGSRPRSGRISRGSAHRARAVHRQLPAVMYQWFSMTDRRSATRGTANSSRSPCISRHVDISAASSMPPRSFFVFRDALVERGKQLRRARQSGVGELGDLSRRLRGGELGNPTGHHRDMQRERAKRPRLFVRSPIQLIRRERARARGALSCASRSSSCNISSINAIGPPDYAFFPAVDGGLPERT